MLDPAERGLVPVRGRKAAEMVFIGIRMPGMIAARMPGRTCASLRDASHVA